MVTLEIAPGTACATTGAPSRQGRHRGRPITGAGPVARDAVRLTQHRPREVVRGPEPPYARPAPHPPALLVASSSSSAARRGRHLGRRPSGRPSWASTSRAAPRSSSSRRPRRPRPAGPPGQLNQARDIIVAARRRRRRRPGPRSPPRAAATSSCRIPGIPTQATARRDQQVLAAAVPPGARRRGRLARRPPPPATPRQRPPRPAPATPSSDGHDAAARVHAATAAPPARPRPRTAPSRRPDGAHAVTPAPRPRAAAEHGDHRRPPPPTPATSPGSPPRSPTQFTKLDCTDPEPVDAIVDDPTKPLVTCSTTTARPSTSSARSRWPARDQRRHLRLPDQPAAASHQRGRDRADASTVTAPRSSATSPRRLVGAARAAEPVRHRPRLAGHRRHRRCNAAITDGQRQHHRRLHPRVGPRPGRPAEVRRAAAVVRRADAGRHQPDPRQRAAAARPDRRPHRPAARRRLLAVPVPRPRASSPSRRSSSRRSITYAASPSWAGRTTSGSTMAGVTGLIVAIGFTADSFIVYFERIRDEVREGRPLAAAVETGWNRARRTILVADGGQLPGGRWCSTPGRQQRARLRLHPRPDDAHRPARRLPLHPPRRGAPRATPVLRRAATSGPASTPSGSGSPARRSGVSPAAASSTPDPRDRALTRAVAPRGRPGMSSASPPSATTSTPASGRSTSSAAQRRWYSISRRHHRPRRCVGIFAQGLNFGHRVPRRLRVPRRRRLRHRATTSRRPQAAVGARRASAARRRHRRRQQHRPGADRGGSADRPTAGKARRLAKAFGVAESEVSALLHRPLVGRVGQPARRCARWSSSCILVALVMAVYFRTWKMAVGRR